ncbi:hypothetical protein V7S57_02590 [Caulobacter sp. CCNWLY153]|uniref:hypothetical protein n=1 Tax=unclassified Caulobacter TaxID=2648921 RepID=UPI002FEFD265
MKYQSILALAAQWLSALSAVLFALAVAMNSWVFSRWGLNFLQFAGASDVIGSGLFLATALFTPALCFGGGWVIGRLVVWERVDPRLLDYALTIVVALWAMFATAAVIHLRWDTSYSRIPFLIFYGLWVSRLNASGRISGVIGGASIAGLALMCASFGFVQVARISQTGFQGRVLVNVSEGACQGQVLWMGERALILRCPNGRIGAVYGPENLRLELRPGDRALEAPSLPPRRGLPRTWGQFFAPWTINGAESP